MSAVAATIHTDGAARGNPGPAAIAFVIERPGQPPEEHAERLGTATNNVAEYTALVAALERAADLGIQSVAIYSDSELMVKQFNGEYAVKNPDLKELHAVARQLARRFERVTLAHVPRARNQRADQLCNAVLDGRPDAPPKPATAVKLAPQKPRPVRNPAVDEQAVACLRAALAAVGRNGAPTPEQVWDQLWSVLEDGGVLKARRSG